MAHSFSQLKANLFKLWGRFTPYLFHFFYWFSFPCIILYGKCPIAIININIIIFILSYN